MDSPGLVEGGLDKYLTSVLDSGGTMAAGGGETVATAEREVSFDMLDHTGTAFGRLTIDRMQLTLGSFATLRKSLAFGLGITLKEREEAGSDGGRKHA